MHFLHHIVPPLSLPVITCANAEVLKARRVLNLAQQPILILAAQHCFHSFGFDRVREQALELWRQWQNAELANLRLTALRTCGVPDRASIALVGAREIVFVVGSCLFDDVISAG